MAQNTGSRAPITYQPASGAAYRAMLTKYQRLLQDPVQCRAGERARRLCRRCAAVAPLFNAAPEHGDSGGSGKTWGALMGVFGLPCNYVRMPDLPGDDDGAKTWSCFPTTSCGAC